MRWKKEARGKPLDPVKARSIFDKLFAGEDERTIASQEHVANSTVYKVAAAFPLFFRNKALED